MSAALPTVALIGRQNVGKSTLFNTLLGEQRAIVSPVEGTTRDRNIAILRWRGHIFQVADTGGIEERPQEGIGASVRAQAEHALASADVLCVIVDGKAGLTREDMAVARLVRASRKPAVLVANKLDGVRERAQLAPEIRRLGFAHLFAVSAKTGAGTGDLLDHLLALLPHRAPQERQDEIRVVLLGKPNVGKSSLVNRLLGEERMIVSPLPHTTRDAQDTLLRFRGQQFRLVDTAGIRRRVKLRGRVPLDSDAAIEQRGARMALAALARADVALVMLDATAPITAHDRHLLQAVEKTNAGVLLLLNKWDALGEKTIRSALLAQQRVRRDIPFLTWAPVLCVSAKTGQRIGDALELAQRIAAARRTTIPQDALQQLVDREIIPRLPLPLQRGRKAAPLTVTQIAAAPPTFRLRIGPRQQLLLAHQRFIIKKIRERFSFIGTPLRLVLDRGNTQR